MNYQRKSIARYWKYILLICFGLVLCIVCVWKADGIYKLVKKMKTAVDREMEYQSMHKENVQIDERISLTDEEDAWYTKYHFISHAGGG